MFSISPIQKLTSAAIVTLTALALVSPSAGAMPLRDGEAQASQPQHVDAAHAALLARSRGLQSMLDEQKAAQAAQSRPAQDLRSPDTVDAALHRNAVPTRGVAPVKATIAAQPVNTDSDGLPWTTIVALSIAGAALLGGIALAVVRSTKPHRVTV